MNKENWKNDKKYEKVSDFGDGPNYVSKENWKNDKKCAIEKRCFDWILFMKYIISR